MCCRGLHSAFVSGTDGTDVMDRGACEMVYLPFTLVLVLELQKKTAVQRKEDPMALGCPAVHEPPGEELAHHVSAVASGNAVLAFLGYREGFWNILSSRVPSSDVSLTKPLRRCSVCECQGERG